MLREIRPINFRRIEWIAIAISVLALSASIASARGGRGSGGGYRGGGGGGFRGGGQTFHSDSPVIHQNDNIVRNFNSMGDRFNRNENPVYSVVPNNIVANNGFGENRATSIEHDRTLDHPAGISRPEMNSNRWTNDESMAIGSERSNNRFDRDGGGSEHRFFGRDHRELFHPIVGPRDRFDVDFHHGHEVFHRHFFPFFHRRDVFVSFFGFWPDYDCMRYYWYGYQPYYWYGYEPYAEYGYGGDYPMTYDTGGNTYNYYYYNYNYGNSEAATETPPAIEDESYPPANPPQEQMMDRGPAPQTSTDQLFDEAVNTFGTGDYSQTSDKLYAAIQQSPNDIVMPFAYVQTLFAQGKYTEAAAVFRTAMTKASTAQKGQPQVFFPRGLYTSDEVLNQQIKVLQEVVLDNPQDTDYQLILGYQLLGAGRANEAIAPLKAAAKDKANTNICNVLLELAQKTNAEAPSISK